MARYRKVDVRLWNDARFRALTDEAKLLWLCLLTHPAMTGLGAMRATREGLARELEWSAKAFREAFNQLEQLGMVEVDWEACYLALPHWLRYNRPESPNVVKSWGPIWDLIPECQLKVSLYQRVKAFAEGLGVSYAKKFAKAFPEGSTDFETDPVSSLPRIKSKSKNKNKSISSSEEDGSEPSPARSSPVPPDLEGLPLYAEDEKLCRRWAELLPAWRKAYPGIDILAEVRKAHAWEVSNPSRRKTDRPAYLRRWLAREQDKAPARGRASSHVSDLTQKLLEEGEREEEDDGVPF